MSRRPLRRSFGRVRLQANVQLMRQEPDFEVEVSKLFAVGIDETTRAVHRARDHVLGLANLDARETHVGSPVDVSREAESGRLRKLHGHNLKPVSVR